MCIAAMLSCVVFIIAIFNRFDVMNLHGFDLTEYWDLAVFGIVFSLIIEVYCLVDIIRLIVAVRAEDRKNLTSPPPKKEGEKKEAPLPTQVEEKQTEQFPPLPSGGDEEFPALPKDFESIPLPSSSDFNTYESMPCEKETFTDTSLPPIELPATPINDERVNSSEEEASPQPTEVKKPTFKDKRKQKMLEEEKPKGVGKFGWFVLAVGIIFGVYFSIWCFCPKGICFHNYTYNTTENPPIEENEQRTLRFYQDYSFTPYYVFFDEGKEFKIKLVDTEGGEDEIGEYLKYTFSAKEKYAKILDCALDRFTYLDITATVKYYKKDARIIVDQSIIINRPKGEEKYNFVGKTYTYKNTSN